LLPGFFQTSSGSFEAVVTFNVAKLCQTQLFQGIIKTLAFWRRIGPTLADE